MKCIVIGLGNYGSILAMELAAQGHEVIGADNRTDKVQNIKDRIATAFVLDAAREDAMSVLPVKEVDVVIVSIGENFGASLRTIALLKQFEAKKIWARAIDEIHRSILLAFNLDRILEPEAYAARMLVQEVTFGERVECFQVDKDYYVLRFRIPRKWIGYGVNDLKLHEEYGIRILSLRRKEQTINAVGISAWEYTVRNELPENELMQEGDELVCYAPYQDFRKLLKDMRAS